MTLQNSLRRHTQTAAFLKGKRKKEKKKERMKQKISFLKKKSFTNMRFMYTLHSSTLLHYSWKTANDLDSEMEK